MALTSIADICSLKMYNGADRIVFVSDQITGGVFYYEDNPCHSYTPYENTFTFNGVEITDGASNSFVDHGFLNGQVITIQGTTYNNGIYVIASVTPEKITIASTGSFENETVASTITLEDGGIIFDAPGIESGYWRRQFDQKDGISVSWFGAQGNALYYNSADKEWYTTTSYTTLANDDTLSIQTTLNYATVIYKNIKKVVIPPGKYAHNTIYVPSGVLLTGSGSTFEALNRATSQLVKKTGGGDSIRLIEKTKGESRLYWFGGITNLEFYGQPFNTEGWAISCRNKDGDVIAPMDMNFFENLEMRNYTQGGIEFPDLAVPLYVKNIKGMGMKNGPVIFIGSLSSGKSGQSLNIDNLSADNCAQGAICLNNLNGSNNVIINNLKSEQGFNTSVLNQPNAQINPIICIDCENSSIIVDNANHQSTGIYPGTLAGNPVISSSNPGTINLSQSFTEDTKVRFYTTGSLPDNIIAGQLYYVLASELSSSSFQISNVPGGPPINTTTGLQSGTHSLYFISPESAVSYTTPGDLISIEKSFTEAPVISISNPAQITLTSHFLIAGDTVKFYTTGELPANIIIGQIYYVLSAGLSTNTFRISTEINGEAVDTSNGTQSGTHRVYKQVITGDLPKLTWRGIAMRVRESDYGIIPFVISKSNTSYTVSQGDFNIEKHSINVIQKKYNSILDIEDSSVETNNSKMLFGTGNVETTSKMTIGGENMFAPAWKKTGINLRIPGASYTDYSSIENETVPLVAINSFDGGDIINCINEDVSLTEATTIYIESSPVSGLPGNPTIGSSYGLIADSSAMVKFKGFVGVGTASTQPLAMLHLQGAFSADSWATKGIQLKISGNTITDNTSSGTITNSYANVINGAKLAAINTLTITDAVTLYIDSPTAGTNSTIVNPYSLKLGGAMKLAAGNTAFAPVKFVSGPDKITWAVGDMGFGPSSGTNRFVLVPTGNTPKRIALINDMNPANGQIPIGNGTDFTSVNLTAGNGVEINNGSGSVTIGLGSTIIQSTDPTTTDIENGNYRIYKNSTTSVIKLWVNDNGNLKSVILS
ncbi:hypothetical protein [Mucilaginibacter segetis]|uniref:Uncharacterized protein n=1 Tax=Mucilaginibacter segetis TaxID=2793071 RepID=A0A934PU75_9SPHI|nr:hypothetical protein [Mucilaginibacter segetis]MBK0380929.1 hypothetical protein [Mucilaginibacter segetis]